MYLLYGKLFEQNILLGIKKKSKNVPVLSLWNPPNPLKDRDFKTAPLKKNWKKRKNIEIQSLDRNKQ